MFIALIGFALSSDTIIVSGYSDPGPSAQRLQQEIEELRGSTDPRVRRIIDVLDGIPTGDQLHNDHDQLLVLIAELEAVKKELAEVKARPIVTVDLSGIERELAATREVLDSRLAAIETAQMRTASAVRGVSVAIEAADHRGESAFTPVVSVGVGGRFRRSTVSDSGLVTPGPAGFALVGTVGLDLEVVADKLDVGARARGEYVTDCGPAGGLDLVVSGHVSRFTLYGVGGPDWDATFPGTAFRVGGGVGTSFGSDHLRLSAEGAYLTRSPSGRDGVATFGSLAFAF